VEDIEQRVSSSGEYPEGVAMWSLAPNFVTKRFKNSDEFIAYGDSLAAKSADKAVLIVWINIRNFADNKFWYPSFNQWIRHGSVLSGSGDRTNLGVVFSNSMDIRWDTKVLWSTSGGVRCSETCKWVLGKTFRKTGGLVCDPYARSPQLAVWCRRLGIAYRGYARDKTVRDAIEKELAQTEIPGIQEELPLLITNGE